MRKDLFLFLLTGFFFCGLFTTGGSAYGQAHDTLPLVVTDTLPISADDSLLVIQPDSVPDVTASQWYLGDPARDKVPGISLDQAYQYLSGRESRRVVVAILDSGFDTAHIDIKENLWVNPREIPGNGIDDDGNGLVDDVHGWNYLGNDRGENIDGETLEMTRLYRQLRPRFGHLRPVDITEELEEEYALYLDVKKTYEKRLDEAANMLRQIDRMAASFDHSKAVLQRYFRDKEFGFDDVVALRERDERIRRAQSVYISIHVLGLNEELEKMQKYYRSMLTEMLNLNHDARSAIIGDNIEDLNDSIFGNNDIHGGTAEHGTAVAAVIGAVRNNGMGIDGIADNVELMIVRVVPGGDEYDKDVALGIRYAVNNGAHIINCSFGKEFSPQKWMVDEAIRYAESRGVLIVHAAGNSSSDNDLGRNFPTPYLDDGTRAMNWIEVGASTRHTNRNMIASFSNYGAERVDLFAPGEDIMTLDPDNGTGSSDGTSLASPVVVGVAALILSYFPDLTAQEVREIIMESVTPYGRKRVNIPGSNKRTRMRNLCVSGGVVNAYRAVKMADERQQQKRAAEEKASADACQ